MFVEVLLFCKWVRLIIYSLDLLPTLFSPMRLQLPEMVE